MHIEVQNFQTTKALQIKKTINNYNDSYRLDVINVKGKEDEKT